MRKDDYNFIKKIIFMLVCLSVLFLVAAGMGNALVKDNKEIKVIELDKGLQEDESTLTYRLKEEYKYKFPVVIVKTDNYIKEARLGNDKLRINELKEKNNKQMIREYYTINLPSEYNGKDLKLKFDLKKSEGNKVLNSIMIMNESDYVYYQIRNNHMAFIIAMALILLGIFIIVICAVITQKTKRIKKLQWTGITFLYISIVMLAEYGILELLINSNRLLKNIKFTGTFLCIPAVLMMAYNTFKNVKYKRIMYIYNIALYVIYVLIRILNNFDILSYTYVMLIMKIFAIITLILLFIYNLASYKKVNAMEKIYTAGISVCYVECIVAIIISMANTQQWDEFNMHFVLSGVAILFVVTIIYYAFIVDGYVNNVMEKRMLYTLAYTDPLTGIMNRSKYEEIIEDLKANELDNISIIMFDLNNLKKINDNQGHEAGDIYIRTFAESISKIFEECDFIGRIGGDEFSIIAQNKNIDIDNNVVKANTIFKELMKEKNYGYEASFAYGYANSVEENVGIDELVNIADERMYSYKAEQKLNKKV